MRLVPAAALAVLATASACGSDPCSLPAHCLAASRVAGACQCTEWETASVEVTALPYVVAAVLYPMAGNESSLHYGAEWTDQSGTTFALSPVGARWRGLVRRADGVEVVARVAPPEASNGSWRLDRVTDATLALTTAAGYAVSHDSSVDVPTHDLHDLLAVWVNPLASVATDYADGKAIRWSGSDAFPECGPGPIRVAWLTPAHLLGTQPPIDACGQAFLSSLDARQRSELLSHDAFYDPPGREPQSLFADPRLSTLENRSVHDYVLSYGKYSWACVTPPADGDLALARSEVPMAGGETLVLEQTWFAADAACPWRSFGFVEGTATLGCSMYAALELDMMFGTALAMADSRWDPYGTPACTR